jgi:glycosyltransferase involved in cell wall biosynthesis
MNLNDIFAKAVFEHQSGNLVDARNEYLNVLHIDGAHKYALNNLSLMLEDHMAIDLLKKALLTDPNYIDALINIGSRFYELKQFLDAKKYLYWASILYPSDDRVVNLLSMIRQQIILQNNQHFVPVYSVIVPTHSRSNLLERCLSSIKMQTSQSQCQIIVVSDFPDDATDQVCRHYLGSHDIYFERHGQPGPAISRNLALKLAQGRIILFLDDDDAWPDHFLADLDGCTDLQNSLPIYFNCTVIEETRSAQGPQNIESFIINTSQSLTDFIFVQNRLPNSCFAYPAELIKGLEFDENMKAYEDWDFVLYCIERLTPQYHNFVGPRIYQVHDETSDRRGTRSDAKHLNALVDYLHVYNKHPVPAHIRSMRVRFLESSGVDFAEKLL